MIEERRADGRDHGDLLSMLLAARVDAVPDADQPPLCGGRMEEGDGTGMSDQQVRDEAMTLFLAGHETTANALAWTWLLLARHPQVAARLHEELDRVLDYARNTKYVKNVTSYVRLRGETPAGLVNPETGAPASQPAPAPVSN